MVTVRNFKIEHAGDLAEIERACFTTPWTAEMLRAETENECSHIYVALLDGKAVGYTVIYNVLGDVDIVRVGVLPQCRRHGIAKALLTHALNEQKGRVFLDVRESNTPAIMLYKSLGFVDTGVRKNYYESPEEDAVLMERKAEGQKTPTV